MTTKNTRIYWLHAVSPVHVGSGTGTGFIDLPIMREKTTEWPLIPGSAVKGVRRDHYEQQASMNKKIVDLAFGRADGNGNDGSNAGAIVFTDARILCLPVASYYGTFAWVTSPMALRRAKRDAELAGIQGFGDIPKLTDAIQAVAPVTTGADRSALVAEREQRVYLADLDLAVSGSTDAAKWADAIGTAVFSGEWREEFKKRFLVVNDDTFTFLCRSACEVQARIRIDEEKKTVKSGQLWYEEALPAESILSGLVWCDRIYEKQSDVKQGDLMGLLCAGELPLQIGGKATVGRGRMRCVCGQ